MKTAWKLIRTEREVDDLIKYCKVTGYCSFDFESIGARVYENDFVPTILGISFQPGSGWVVPLAHKDSPFRRFWKKIFKKIAIEIIENPAITKVAWNGIFDGKIFRKYGYRVRGRYMDAMLAKYILNEERPNDLKSMVDLLLPEFGGYDLAYKPSSKADQSVIKEFWANVPIEELSQYCAGDCDFTLRIFLHLENRLIETGLYYWLRNFYMPLVRIITETTLHGMLVDEEYLRGLVDSYAEDILDLEVSLFDNEVVKRYNEIIKEERVDEYIQELEDEIASGTLSQRQIDLREEKISRLEAGETSTKKEEKLLEDVNFGSPKQLISLLYEHEDGFEFPIYERSNTGNPSTAESALLKLKPDDDTGFIDSLLKYRAKQKLYSTYVKGIYDKNLTNNHPFGGYRVFPGFLLHGTVTSRFSSRGPNLQNIPRSATATDIKRMFIAPRDYYFTEFDLSQAELRIAAEMSNDPAMIEVFAKDQNIHVATAAKMFGVDYDLLNKARKDETHPQHLEMVKKHKAAKILNFTIFYGAGPKKVAEFLTEKTGDYHSVQDAVEFIEKWFESFPQAEKWIKKVKRLAIKQGYSENLFGWRRRLPILNDPRNKKYEPGKWNEALRQAVNSGIQGASSTVTQWINIQIYLAVLRGDLPDYLRLICTVHDSLEFYIHKDDFKETAETILAIVRDLPDLGKYLKKGLKKTVMKASCEFGTHWGHMLDYGGFKDADFLELYEELKY